MEEGRKGGIEGKSKQGGGKSGRVCEGGDFSRARRRRIALPYCPP